MRKVNPRSQQQTLQQLSNTVSNEKQIMKHNSQRVKNDIRNLFLELSQDNFKIKVIQQTAMRTVLQIFYYSSDSQFINNQNKQINSDVKQKQFMRPQQGYYFEEEEQFAQSQLNKNEFKSKFEEKISLKEKIVFTCFLDYDLYPFMPPYIVLTQYDVYQEKPPFNNALKFEDFRSIVTDILKDLQWFPIYSIYNILVQIPAFIKKVKQNGNDPKGSYYYGKPFKMSDILQYAPGLKLCQIQLFVTKDVFIGRYQKRILGISFKSLIIFQKDQTNGLHIKQLYSLSDTQDIKLQQNSERLKAILTFKNRYQIIYRIKFKRQLYKNSDHLNFIIWMKICFYDSILYKFHKNQEQINENNLKSVHIMKNQSIEMNSSDMKNIPDQKRIKNIMYEKAKGKEKEKEKEKQKKKEKQKGIQKFYIDDSSLNNLKQKQQLLSKVLQLADYLMSFFSYSNQESCDKKEQQKEQFQGYKATNKDKQLKNKEQLIINKNEIILTETIKKRPQQNNMKELHSLFRNHQSHTKMVQQVDFDFAISSKNHQNQQQKQNDNILYIQNDQDQYDFQRNKDESLIKNDIFRTNIALTEYNQLLKYKTIISDLRRQIFEKINKQFS